MQEVTLIFLKDIVHYIQCTHNSGYVPKARRHCQEHVGLSSLAFLKVGPSRGYDSNAKKM